LLLGVARTQHSHGPTDSSPLPTFDPIAVTGWTHLTAASIHCPAVFAVILALFVVRPEQVVYELL